MYLFRMHHRPSGRTGYPSSRSSFGGSSSAQALVISNYSWWEVDVRREDVGSVMTLHEWEWGLRMRALNAKDNASFQRGTMFASKKGEGPGVSWVIGDGSRKRTAGEDILSYPFLGLELRRGQLMGEIAISGCR